MARFETQYLPTMPNVGKIKRVIREVIAVLVDELGPERAAQVLEDAAAEVRGAGRKPIRATAHDQGRLQTDRKTAQVIPFGRKRNHTP